VGSLAAYTAHLGWTLRKRRAQFANAVGLPFTYEHPILGPFVYHPSDDLSRHLLLYDFEPAELRFAIQQASAGGTIVDVGANIGAFTVACARAAGGRGRVVALEPAPATFAKLARTCRQLGIENVELLQRAAAAGTGRRQLVTGGIHELRQHLRDGREASSDHLTDVEAVRLDDVCGPPEEVTLLKMDVEGHEVEALSGAARILHNGRACLIVEVYPRGLAAAGASPAALQQLLSATHTCTAVVRQDGEVLPGDSPLIVSPPAETLNTLWMPKSRAGL
jgi:FkbM family methyltransferase